jgi:hypothetical protein
MKNQEVNRLLSEISKEAEQNRKNLADYQKRNNEELKKMLEKTLRGFRRRH